VAKPQPTTYTIRESKPFHGKTWRVEAYIDGKRKIHWFTTEKEAKAFANDKNRDLTTYGSKVQLDPIERTDAYKAYELLEPYDKSLLEAATFFVKHLEETTRSKALDAFADEIEPEIAAKVARNKLRPRSAESFRETLRKLRPRFAGRILSEITASEISTWLHELGLSDSSKKRHRTYTHQLFELARKRHLITANPVKDVEKIEATDNEEEITTLSPDQLTKLLKVAAPEIRPLIAIAAFAGVRWGEIARLNWADVKGDVIVISKGKGKVRSRRVVTIRENLKPYLLPYRDISSPLIPSKQRVRNLREAAQAKAGLVPWPNNVLRHSFISYLYALTDDENKVAAQAGNSPEVIHKNYRALVTKADAERYFAL
jgi:integrase